MYRHGDLKVILVECPRCKAYECEEHFGDGMKCEPDQRGDDGGEQVAPQVSLPHSCEAWVIGGPEQAMALIADLQAALASMGRGTSAAAPLHVGEDGLTDDDHYGPGD